MSARKAPSSWNKLTSTIFFSFSFNSAVHILRRHTNAFCLSRQTTTMLPQRNEYSNEAEYLYYKSLILESPSEMDPVLYFYLIDAVAHLDYTLSSLAYNPDSIRCVMTAEYLRRRVDLAKEGDNALFPGFMVWLRDTNQEMFESCPMLWQLIYDPDECTRYVGFRIVLDPASRTPLPPQFFRDMADDIFSQQVLRSIYPAGALGKLFAEYKAKHAAR